jgi:gamma-glutamylcyclotransferase (GGCT)/AIG2-like uncharacterized protein YtfP
LSNDIPTIALFVYGTLKRGFHAHESFFGEKVEAEEAVVRGSLFDLPAGFPALAVPERDILAVGTAEPLADAETCRRGFSVRQNSPAPEETVHGDVLFAASPGRFLPTLDAFEGFRPEGENLYSRVLVPAWTASGEAFPVWVYVMEDPGGTRLPDGRWRPSGKTSS